MEPNLQPQADPVMEAMTRRGLGDQAPQMSQEALPTGTPNAQSMPPAPPMPMGAPMQGAPQGMSDKFVPKDSHELLVSTLAESLKNEYKLKGEQAKFGSPQMSQV